MKNIIAYTDYLKESVSFEQVEIDRPMKCLQFNRDEVKLLRKLIANQSGKKSDWLSLNLFADNKFVQISFRVPLTTMLHLSIQITKHEDDWFWIHESDKDAWRWAALGDKVNLDGKLQMIAQGGELKFKCSEIFGVIDCIKWLYLNLVAPHIDKTIKRPSTLYLKDRERIELEKFKQEFNYLVNKFSTEETY